MDKGNLHVARGEFVDAREDYQNAHDKMFAVNPTSVMVGITQYKLAVAKMKLATAADYPEARCVTMASNVQLGSRSACSEVALTMNQSLQRPPRRRSQVREIP